MLMRCSGRSRRRRTQSNAPVTSTAPTHGRHCQRGRAERARCLRDASRSSASNARARRRKLRPRGFAYDFGGAPRRPRAIGVGPHRMRAISGLDRAHRGDGEAVRSFIDGPGTAPSCPESRAALPLACSATGLRAITRPLARTPARPACAFRPARARSRAPSRAAGRVRSGASCGALSTSMSGSVP